MVSDWLMFLLTFILIGISLVSECGRNQQCVCLTGREALSSDVSDTSLINSMD